MLLVASTSVRPEVLAEVSRLDPSQTRMRGEDRYGTSAAVARQGSFATPRAQVFVASGTSFPDALALAAVAANRRAPLLLTKPDRVPPVIDTEIRRLATPRAIIAGGTQAVSTSAEAQVRAALR